MEEEEDVVDENDVKYVQVLKRYFGFSNFRKYSSIQFTLLFIYFFNILMFFVNKKTTFDYKECDREQERSIGGDGNWRRKIIMYIIRCLNINELIKKSLIYINSCLCKVISFLHYT